ncbi:CDP-alcohol phosphatidyltransferase family protein [Sphingobacterium griseoflavum]|uniref:CDP-diacylglycerol--serine O-phosphatidyltransferase n=1 Tax=Sphingobacterium griseoflavum TaxID=1474952 RepID=A0ABQ3HYY4_9SPHI|nr:CDP-alcohol phosphatidyltransferase family protein [Sphingobacterium griseoflavum]GHE47635.1 CDP-diacylglycerol--serine O-phosphatidyltransferase [Sphingobacterium griseoflavum]
MKKHLPNTLTCLNLFSGCLGVLFALKASYLPMFYCVLASGVFDFFDGMLARALNVKSHIGKELDSLADMVSFGFLPGAVLYMLLQEASSSTYVPYLGFVVTVFSALRLAKFNVDDRQTNDFIGLNTPMNTFVIAALPFISQDVGAIRSVYVLLFLVILLSFLLISEIRLFSMKLVTLAWRPNKFKYIFVVLSIFLILFLKFTALPIVLFLYILLSFLHFANGSNQA